MGYYDIKTPRKIECCQLNVHKSPVAHPTRVLAVHDILYCVRGEWEILLDGTPYTMRKDDCLLLHAGMMHSGVGQCPPGTAVFFIHLEPSPDDVFGPVADPSPWLVSIDPLVHCKGNPEIRRLFEEIVSLFWDSSNFSSSKNPSKPGSIDFWFGTPPQIKASLLCNLLLCRLSECVGDPRSALPECVRECLRYFDKNPDRFVSAGEVAETLFISERTLRNSFKKIYGQTPYQFQREIKLSRAAALLREQSTASVKEIAGKVGFCDQAYFCKVFKMRFGRSPASFRDSVS